MEDKGLQENVKRIKDVMGVITEESKNETIIKKVLESLGIDDLDINYSNSYYHGNGPLTHKLELYFVDKDGGYLRYASGNAMSVMLYFRVRNNEPYLVDMSKLPGNFLGALPSDLFEKFLEEKGANVLKRVAKSKGGFENWV
jgi:hypothetical protein